jgi:hypothetical protein
MLKEYRMMVDRMKKTDTGMKSQKGRNPGSPTK